MPEIEKLPSTLPPASRKVFSGEIFDVYQWPQELYDGSVATFEKLKRKDTVVVIPITVDGRIILLEQEQPTKPLYTGFPGGQMEWEEGVEEAAGRELLEETGYRAASFELLAAGQPYSKIDWTIYMLIGRGCERVAEQSLDAGEKISVGYVTFEELVGLVKAGRIHEPQLCDMVLRSLLDPEKFQRLQDRLSI